MTQTAAPPTRGVDDVLPEAESRFRHAMRSLMRHKPALLGALVLVTMVLVALFPSWVTPYSPLEQFVLEARKPPLTYIEGSSRFALLGTDHLGRDVFTRLAYAAQVTLIVAFATSILAGVIGLVIGIISGYVGGWVDVICMRIVDVALAFPFILLALSLVAVLKPSLQVVIIIISIRTWVIYARVVRGSTLSEKEKDFVQAAVAEGMSRLGIMLRHILPNVLAPAVVIGSLNIGRMIIIESSLSFLGMGVPPPTPTWGGILGDGRIYIDTAWWIAFFPGLAIMVTVLGANLLGDWLRDYLDPRLRE